LKNLNPVPHRIVIRGGEDLKKYIYIYCRESMYSVFEDKTVPVTNMNKYLYSGKNEIELNINNSRIC